MFSQFKNAFEQLAQPIHDATLGSSSGEHDNNNNSNNNTEGGHNSRSQSFDLKSGSPGHLAETTISNLRKSFVSGRSSTTSPPQSNSNGSPPTTNSNPRPKSNLEERLRRATYAVGDPAAPSSSSSAPSRTGGASPAPTNRTPLKRQSTMSPSTTPLTRSPAVKPTVVSHPLEQPAEMSLSSSTTTEVKKPSTPDPSPVVEQAQATPPIPSREVESTTPAPPAPVAETRKEVEELPAAIISPASEPQPVDPTPAPPTETQDSSPLPSMHTETETTHDTSTTEDEDEDSQLKEDVGTPATVSVSVDEAKDVPSTELSSSDVSTEPTDPPSPGVESTSPPSENLSLAPSPLPLPESDVPADVQPVVESSAGTVQQPPPEIPKLVAAAENDKKLEEVQERLKQVEQRFSDVSTSFKRLQAEKMAADAVLRELTPLETIKDADALREFFNGLKTKDHVFQDEIKRLNQKLEVQEDRLEEIREIHAKESSARSEEMGKIRTQLDETEALFQAAQRATTEAEDASSVHKQEIARLAKEVEAAKGQAKEEEEKRVKAISLLKTVRQKLVKAEKERDDTVKEVGAFRERERGDKDKEQADKAGYQAEMDALKAANERTSASLKAQFEKEIASTRERYEQEMNNLRAQFESESTQAKETFSKELSTKSSQISSMQSTLNNLTREKNAFFEQLQLGQAEQESAQEHLGSLQHENTELQFQLREANDRLALLQEEVAELMREQESRARDPAASADEIARVVASVETKYEAKLTELRRNLNVVEKERYDSEAEWSRKVKEKVKELEEYKRILGSTAKSREEESNMIVSLKTDLVEAKDLVKVLQKQVLEIPVLRNRLVELEKILQDQEEEIKVKTAVFEKQTEESKVRESQLKATNKTFRDELRKVQSSAALLEKQRNPGVGYWTNRPAEANTNVGAADIQTSLPSASVTQTPSRTSSPAPTSAASTKSEEEVNLEYLRNVIFQFLEHKEMRPNLVKVLSIILHFTPQETRRLMAKV